MQATYTVRLRERGQLTLPQAVRRNLAVDEGDILNLVQIDDLAVLARRPSLLPKLSQEFTAIMKEGSPANCGNASAIAGDLVRSAHLT